MRKEVSHKIFAKGNGGTVFSAKITPKNLVKTQFLQIDKKPTPFQYR